MFEEGRGQSPVWEAGERRREREYRMPMEVPSSSLAKKNNSLSVQGCTASFLAKGLYRGGKGCAVKIPFWFFMYGKAELGQCAVFNPITQKLFRFPLLRKSAALCNTHHNKRRKSFVPGVRPNVCGLKED